LEAGLIEDDFGVAEACDEKLRAVDQLHLQSKMMWSHLAGHSKKRYVLKLAWIKTVCDVLAWFAKEVSEEG